MKRVIGALLLFLTLALLVSCHVSHPEAQADFHEPEVSPPRSCDYPYTDHYP